MREFKSARIYPIRVREFKTREFKSARKIVLREFKYTQGRPLYLRERETGQPETEQLSPGMTKTDS